MNFNSAQKSITGLTEAEALSRLAEHGENTLPETPPPTDLQILLSQLKSPLVYILLAAGFITLVLKEYPDTAIILLSVAINSILGFIQERNANKALDALKKMLHPYAMVLRDGEVKSVSAESLVPGDIVYLSQGVRIPADGEVMEVNRFFADEAILTGESVPVGKRIKDTLYMGTMCSGGTATMLVTQTGRDTEMGRIALTVGSVKEITPLGKQIEILGNRLSRLVILLLLIVVAVGVFTGKSKVEMFKTAVALAVSAIPEGLLIALTVVLAIGMQRILARKGLVRNLVSAETLGGVTVICVDKTGTLTEGKMKVSGLYGNESGLAEQVILANEMDDPIMLSAWDWGKDILPDYVKFMETNVRLDSIPFDSNERLYLSLNEYGDAGNVVFMNGAPEVVLERCEINQESRDEILNRIHTFTSEGKRLLGFAKKVVGKEKQYLTTEDSHSGFEWVGILAFFDPIRPDVREAFEQTRKAGIKLAVITGDFSNTAEYVLNEMGIEISDNDIIQGDSLKNMSKEELRKSLSFTNSRVKLFARTRPEQKLQIVENLKENGEVVAMMGDGVNDAPALSRADIGIVVGEASEVSKESADLVLLDSKFSTILAAIEEGRGIFDNIRKIILYLMCDAFVEIIVVVFALVAFKPLPITPAQILWINLVSDGFPHLALTIDPKTRGIMRRKPRSPKEPLVAGWMSLLIALVSIIGGVLAIIVYVTTLNATGSEEIARSAVFATIGIKSLVYIFSVKTLQDSFWEQNPFNNRWLIVAVIVGLCFIVTPFVFEPLGKFLHIVPIGFYWAYAVLAALLMFFSIEFSKNLFWRRSES